MLMLGEFFAHARAFFGIPHHPDPIWNDRDALNALWEEAKQRNPERRLGTAGEARQTLAEYEEVFHDQLDYLHSIFSEKKFCRDTDGLRELFKGYLPSRELGDVTEVSYLFGKKLSVGYIIETDATSGLRREHIESRAQQLVVLRKHGRIIAAYPGSIIRMESRGGITIM